MAKDESKLHELIVLFLQVNPEPSDDQFHALAHALGVDKETLEACSYEMLGDEIQHEEGEGDDAQLEELVEGVSTHFPEGDESGGGEYGEGYPITKTEAFVINAAYRLNVTAEVAEEYGEEGLSEQQEVLEGEGDPSTTNTDDMVLNDGAPVGQSTDDEMQDSQLVDGVGPDDTGVGFESDKSMLLNDGAPALQLQNASSRRLTAAGLGDLMDIFGMPADHLKKKSGTLETLGEIADRKPNKIVGVSISSAGPGGIKRYYFLGSAAGLKQGTRIKFKGSRGIVDLIADIKADGSVSIKNQSSQFDPEAKRQFYVFK